MSREHPSRPRSRVPSQRVTPQNEAPLRPDGEFVLYWMIAARRPTYNFGLERAAEWAAELGKPLVVFEGLRCDYRWASDRLHRFVIEGMQANAAHFAGHSVTYLPYVEPEKGGGKGLLAALAASACVVITDEFPCFFLPAAVAAAGRKLGVRLEKVDSNGLLPLAVNERAFTTAYSFRRHLQKMLPDQLGCFPLADPLAGRALPRLAALPTAVSTRWGTDLDGDLDPAAATLDRLPIDHTVVCSLHNPEIKRGGFVEALRRWRAFASKRMERYADERNRLDATSGLSPYLHFGHIGVHQIVGELLEGQGWSRDRAEKKASGQRGWWGLPDWGEDFLDQIVTWRELSFNGTARIADYDRYETLPAWALRTLAEHAADPRPHGYPPDALERAQTYDPLWNAAQNQLVQEGSMPNYLRMLWGKKILEWSPTPQQALEVMIELNNKYALDGRDPCSYSGIFWVLGRYDRAFGPERSIFGKVRYMSSANTARKLRVKDYIARYAGDGPEGAAAQQSLAFPPSSSATSAPAR